MRMNQRRGKSLVSSIVSVLLVAATVFFTMDFLQASSDLKRLEEQLTVSKDALDSIQRDNVELQKQKEKLSDPNYMQDYARGNFMLSQEGEQIFILPSKDN